MSSILVIIACLAIAILIDIKNGETPFIKREKIGGRHAKR